MSPDLPASRPVPRLLLGAACALAITAHVASAAEVVHRLTGVVHEVTVGSKPEVVGLLAALGVTEGAVAELTLVVDDTTPGTPNPVRGLLSYTDYIGSIVDARVTVGSYEASLIAGINSVTVGNDNVFSGFAVDSFVFVATAYDTDGILSLDDFAPECTIGGTFTDITGAAAQDAGLVQDLSGFQSAAYVSVYNSTGAIDMWFFDDDAPGPDLGAAAVAREGQLKAAATLSGKVLKGLGRLATAGADKDPGGAKQSVLLAKSGIVFEKQFLAAVTKALKKGGTAPLPASSVQVAKLSLVDGLIGRAAAVRVDVDEADRNDRVLRGALMKAAGKAVKAEFKAQAKHVRKPDTAKLAASVAKARAQLDTAVAKALAKAAKKDVRYGGPDAAALTGSLEELVDDFVSMTAGG